MQWNSYQYQCSHVIRQWYCLHLFCCLWRRLLWLYDWLLYESDKSQVVWKWPSKISLDRSWILFSFNLPFDNNESARCPIAPLLLLSSFCFGDEHHHVCSVWYLIAVVKIRTEVTYPKHSHFKNHFIVISWLKKTYMTWL